MGLVFGLGGRSGRLNAPKTGGQWAIGKAYWTKSAFR
ncbi:predicted protein [Brucella abortus bv. 3 str. Tulya]|nr:predicted protein [Brucella abortus bv. 3 str. Tulya]